MDSIREWITTIAGVIAIAAICDVIMTDGEMKKYLKPILGFVMIITVVQPLIGISENVTFGISEVSATMTSDISDEIESLEQINITGLYKQKLAEQIEEKIKKLSKDYIHSTVCVTTEYSGEIKQVAINFNQMVGASVVNKIKQSISKEFGVDVGNIVVVFGKE